MGEEVEPEAPKKKATKKKATTSEWKHAGWVSGIGKWAWIVAMINGILGIILSLYWIISTAIYWETVIRPLYESLFLPVPPMPIGLDIWYLIGSAITLIVSIVIIRPKFSKRCGEKDWDALYEWVLNLGKLRFPWMLFWGVLVEIVSLWWWGGILILIPAFVLLFAGPKKYKWTRD